MTTFEKVQKYVNEHSGPFTIEKLANYYLIGKTSVRESLNKLENEQQLIRTKKGNTAVWHKPVRRMAFPEQFVEIHQPPTYNRPIQNSYPFVRGYDD